MMTRKKAKTCRNGGITKRTHTAQLRKHVLVPLLVTSFVVTDHSLAVQDTLFGSLQNREIDMTPIDRNTITGGPDNVPCW